MKQIKTLTPWEYNIDLTDKFGFVYRITNLSSGKFYIGQKQLVRRCKSKLLPDEKWKTYRSSCKSLIADIDKLGINNFKFEILCTATSKNELNYLELERQIIEGALIKGSYNGWASVKIRRIKFT